jgi:serine/threonine protein kinase
LLARDGQLKVLDFGLVRLSSSVGRTSVKGAHLLGTAAYIAPEQFADGSAVDCGADVYALGGTLYFLLAGHPPFQHADVLNRLKGKPHAAPVPVHHLRPDVPEGLSAVIAAMLADRPDRRPPTPAAAARLLARWADPAFADSLFARLARTTDDTPSEGTPFTPAPVHSVDAPTDRSPSPRDSTAEVPALLPADPPPPQDTVRVAQPTLVRPPSSPGQWILWLLAGAVVCGLCVVAALIIAFAMVR